MGTGNPTAPPGRRHPARAPEGAPGRAPEGAPGRETRRDPHAAECARSTPRGCACTEAVGARARLPGGATRNGDRCGRRCGERAGWRWATGRCGACTPSGCAPHRWERSRHGAVNRNDPQRVTRNGELGCVSPGASVSPVFRQCATPFGRGVGCKQSQCGSALGRRVILGAFPYRADPPRRSHPRIGDRRGGDGSLPVSGAPVSPGHVFRQYATPSGRGAASKHDRLVTRCALCGATTRGRCPAALTPRHGAPGWCNVTVPRNGNRRTKSAHGTGTDPGNRNGLRRTHHPAPPPRQNDKTNNRTTAPGKPTPPRTQPKPHGAGNLGQAREVVAPCEERTATRNEASPTRATEGETTRGKTSPTAHPKAAPPTKKSEAKQWGDMGRVWSFFGGWGVGLALWADF